MSDEPTTKQEPSPTDTQVVVAHLATYLQTDKGHEMASKIVEFFREWRGQSLKINTRSAILATVSQLLTIGLVLGVMVYVTVNGKMDPVVAGLLGTLAGFALGRKAS